MKNKIIEFFWIDFLYEQGVLASILLVIFPLCIPLALWVGDYSEVAWTRKNYPYEYYLAVFLSSLMPIIYQIAAYSFLYYLATKV